MQKSIIDAEGGYACELRIAPDDPLGNVAECVPQQFALGQKIVWHIVPTGEVIWGVVESTDVRVAVNPDARAMRRYRVVLSETGLVRLADESDLLAYNSGWSLAEIFAWFLSSAPSGSRNTVIMDAIEEPNDVPAVFANFINAIDDSDSIGVGE